MDTGAGRGVSFVMPILNEAEYVEMAVTSVLNQRYDGPVEVILALAPSDDGTEEVVRRLVRDDDRVRIVENPDMHISAGLNLAMRSAQYPVVIRVDAHSQLDSDYTARGVHELRKQGAANLGGIMVAIGKPGFQRAVARAYNSRLGLGGADYHRERAEAGPAESAYLGVMDSEAVRAVGGYDESLRRGEDWEMNLRLRKAGHLVWLDPTLRVRYWPRGSCSALARQFIATGIWRGQLTRRLGGRNPLRFFAPPVLVVNIAVSLIAAGLHMSAITSGVWTWLLTLAYLGPLAYVILLVAILLASGGSIGDRLRFSLALITMHLCWGAGFLIGALGKAHNASDTSRLRARTS